MINNLKLKGSFQIKFVGEDGKVRQTVEKTNNLTEFFWTGHDKYAGSFGAGFSDSGLLTPKLANTNIHISIANLTEDYGRELFYVHNIFATGAENIPILGNKTQVYYATDVSPIGYIEVRERINFTDSIYGAGNGYSRVFNCIAITQGITSSGDNTRVGNTSTYTYPVSSVFGPCYAYTILTPVCTQLSNEFLDIVYKIQVSGDDYLVINSYLDSLNGPDSTNAYLNRNRITLTKVTPVEDNLYNRYSSPYDAAVSEEILQIFDTEVVRLNQSRNLKHIPNVPINRLRGRILRSVLLGVIRQGDHHNLTGSEVKFSSSKFQPLYSHNIQANTPYYDINTLASGSIRPNLSGSWDREIPEMYMILVSSGGAMGVSTYKYAKRKFLGTSNATSWNGVPSFTPFLHKRGTNDSRLHTRYHFKSVSNSEAMSQRIRYSDTQIIQGSTTGILLVNIFTGEFKAWDSTSTPALTANAITQFCLRGTDIYVACRNSGLWRIDTVGNTVSNISTVPCLGVDCNANRIIALFDDSGTLKLKSNADNFSAYLNNFSFPLTNLLNSSLANLLYLKIDNNLSASSNRIAIAAISAVNTYRIYWWDSNDGILIAGPTVGNIGFVSGGLNSIAANPTILVSNNVGAWVLGVNREGRYCIFGTANMSTSNRGSLIGNSPLITEDGGFLHTTGVATPTLLSADINNTVNRITFSGIEGSTGIAELTQPSAVYLGDGIILHDNILRMIPNNAVNPSGTETATSTSGRFLNPYLWDIYAWDVDEWVLDNPSWSGTQWVASAGVGKQTHTSVQPLNSEVSISFTELASSGLVATNYYTQIVANGVSLDDMTTPFSFSYYWGYLETLREEVGTGFSIPSSAPYIRLLPKSNYLDNPSADPNFCCVFTDDLTKHSFNIDGYSQPAQLIVDQTDTPGPNEILINASNGALLFNSADAGKNITSSSSYTYITGHNKVIDFSVDTPFAGVHRPVILLRSDLGVVTSGSNITGWQDQSGYGNNASKVSGANPVKASLNGIDTVLFNNTTSYLQLPNIASFCDGWSLVTLIKFNNIAGTQTFFSSDFLSNGIDGQFRIQNEATGRISFSLFTRFDSTTLGSRNIRTGNNVIAAGNWALLSITSQRESRYSSDSNLIIRVDGINQVTSVTGGTITSQHNPRKYPSDRCHLGGTLITPSDSFLGEIGFFAFYKNYLTVVELERVEEQVRAIFSL